MPKQIKTTRKKTPPQKDKPTTNLSPVLQRLHLAEPRITGSAIVHTEGRIVASRLPQSAQKNRVGSIASAMLAIGQQTVAEFEQGVLARVLIESATGLTLITTAGTDALLVVLARKDAKLGSLFMQIDRAVAEIRGLVDAQADKQ